MIFGAVCGIIHLRTLVLLSRHPLFLLLHQLVVESPVIALLSRPLVMPPSRLLTSPLIVLLLHHPFIVSLRRLVAVVSPLIVLPSCPLVVPHSHCTAALPSHRADWLLHRLLVFLSHRTLVLLTSSRFTTLSSSHCDVWLLRHLSSRYRLVLLSSSHCATSRHLALAGCCVASRCTNLSSYRCTALLSSRCEPASCCVASIKRCHHH